MSQSSSAQCIETKQGGFQNEETKNHGPNERTDQTPEKQLNKTEISNLSDAEFKTLVKRMLKELSENLSSIKRIQSETKDTLSEVKNNLEGNNSRVDEAKNQINDLEHKVAKNNQSEQQEEKRIQKSKDLQPKLLYPAKLLFRIKRQIKSFPDKKKLMEFITTKPVLCEMLKSLLEEEEDEKYEQQNDNKCIYINN